MEILKKNPNKVEVETEIDDYKKNFNSELIWKDEINIKIDKSII